MDRANFASSYTMSLFDRNLTGTAKCDSEKDLGITIDNELDFAEHNLFIWFQRKQTESWLL